MDKEEGLSRRELLGAAISTIVLSGCAEPTPKDKLSYTSGKERLISEINALNDSPTKKALVDRVLHYFKEPKPSEITIGGTHFPLHNSEVKLVSRPYPNRDFAFVEGDSTMLSENLSPKSFRNVESTVIRIPLWGMFRDDELLHFASSDFAIDGKTPLYEVGFMRDKTFFYGIAPEITFTFPDLASRSSDAVRSEVENQLRFGFIKEACGFLLDDIWIAGALKRMQSWKLPIRIKGETTDGKIDYFDGIIPALGNILNKEGRLVALFDLGSYMLALKLLENQPVIDTLRKDTNYANALSLLSTFNLPEDPETLLNHTFEWVLTHPKIDSLFHVGNLKKIP